MLSRFQTITASVCLLVCFSCGQTKQAPPSAPEKPKTPPVSSIDVPKDREANDVARFLAGLKGNPGSPFAESESSAAWKTYSAAFDTDFARYETKRIPAMRAFQKSELSGPVFDGANLFYPFGGPDFLNALIFFPDRENYFFIGLEPPGSVPTFKQFEGQDMATQLPRMRKTLRSLLSLSYFQTLEMAIQVKGQITDGLLPVMLVQMARSGFEVLGSTPVTIDDRGFIVRPEDVKEEPAPELVAGKKAPAPIKRTPGIVIAFRKEGGTKIQKLYYFSTDVIDLSIKKNKPFLAFLPRMEPMDAMYKAASYLSHRESFSIIRSKVLELAQAVVEDDSGIPYRFFDHDTWDITLYGGYTTPIPIFVNRMQPDLREAYKNGVIPVKSLDFGIGYSVSQHMSNLLVAKRKPAAVASIPKPAGGAAQKP
ncbi:MAG TPA: hypothetical protein VGL53_02380 [Bryobacteraceae bacterium]